MSNQASTTEEFFLKIFKIIVLTIMSLTLLCAVGAIGFAAYQYSQSPKAPAPAEKAPATSVNVDDFLKQLKPDAPKQAAPIENEAKKVEPEQKPAAVKYKEEAKKIVGCDLDSIKQAKITATDPDEETVEAFRKEIQRIADHKSADRGQPFASDLVKVSCAIFLHTQVIEYRKSHRDADTFADAINFHIKAWDTLKDEAAKFEQDELYRVKKEEQEENMRVDQSKEAAQFSLLVAAGTFAIFMALALYLIISAIESNLRRINSSIVKLSEVRTAEASVNSVYSVSSVSSVESAS